MLFDNDINPVSTETPILCNSIQMLCTSEDKHIFESVPKVFRDWGDFGDLGDFGDTSDQC